MYFVWTTGVVHIIDKVLLLPYDTVTTATNGGLTTLVQAVTKAGFLA